MPNARLCAWVRYVVGDADWVSEFLEQCKKALSEVEPLIKCAECTVSLLFLRFILYVLAVGINDVKGADTHLPDETAHDIVLGHQPALPHMDMDMCMDMCTMCCRHACKHASRTIDTARRDGSQQYGYACTHALDEPSAMPIVLCTQWRSQCFR